jgi:peptide deformylase
MIFFTESVKEIFLKFELNHMTPKLAKAMTKKMNKAEGIAISALQTYYMALVRKTA